MEKKKLFYTILGILALTRIVLAFLVKELWWDTAVYIGMGKYIFSSGTIGLWESYRPYLLSTILGFFWKIGLDPWVVGIELAILSSVGVLVMTYLIGQKLDEKTGIISMIMFGLTPIFFSLSIIPLTGIPALFFALLAVYLVLEKKYFLSGILAGIAFNMRFPLGLIIIAIGLYILITEYKKLSLMIKNGLITLLGFLLIITPYFLINYYLYGDIFLPFQLAKETLFYSIIPRGYFYYPLQLIINNPLFILAPVGIVLGYKKLKNNAFLITTISLFLLAAYFTYEPHKEIRYAIAFMPFLAILSSYVIYCFVKKLSFEKLSKYLVSVSLIIGIIILVVSVIVIPNDGLSDFHKSLSDKGEVSVVGTEPQIVVYSDIFLEKYAYWPNLDYEGYDYLMYNSCTLDCRGEEYCESAKTKHLMGLQSKNLTYSETINGCELKIYEL